MKCCEVLGNNCQRPNGHRGLCADQYGDSLPFDNQRCNGEKYHGVPDPTLREYILAQIDYWDKRQPEHSMVFYKSANRDLRRCWADLEDSELVDRFSIFMMRHGRMR